MAGIGFALNKLMNKKSFVGKISGYFYTASSCLGSMIMGFILLFAIQYFAKALGQDTVMLETFTSYITNMVFLSMIIFSIFSLVLSRYLSDMIYMNKKNHIMSSFWGVISIIMPLSYIIVVPILFISKIELTYIILLSILLTEFVCTWVVNLYVTILKKYKKITITYLIAVILSVLLLIVCYKINFMSMNSMLSIIIFSYGIVLIFLIVILQKQFDSDTNYTYEFLKWFSKFPLLIFTGLFSTLGSLIHFYIMWFGPNGKEVQGLIHCAPNYDLPAIIAFFSTIITSITFIAVLEPNFYKKYSKYFKLLNSSGTYQQLQNAKKEMQISLKTELRNLILKQLVCTLFFVIVISQILSNLNIGMTKSLVECFKVLCIGYSLYAIGNVILQMQLYFSDNKGAFRTSLIFLVSTSLITCLTLFLNQTFWGIGLVVGSAAMAIYGSKRLENYINNLEYNVLNKKETTIKDIFYNFIKRQNIRVKMILKNKVLSAILNIALIVVLSTFLIASVYKGERITNKTFTLSDNGTILNNAGVGLAPWAKNDATLNMKTNLVYIDLSWAEWEPKEGKFDTQTFEIKNHIQEYKSQGRQAVFRFYMDYPSEQKHMDIPQWLYEKIKYDGTWYNTSYGKGFSPNYSNTTLIKCHEKAIEALAKTYGDDNFFIYIELGSVGHWGEWHVNHEEGVKQLPEYEIRKQYIKPYTNNFKNAKFLMRYPILETADFNCGLYNDMIGDRNETEYWFEGMKGEEIWEQTGKNELVNTVDRWKTAPIGGEFASSYDNSYFMKKNLDITLMLLKKSHQSFIGPKIIVDENNEENYNKAMSQILKVIGHRLYASKVKISQVNDKKLELEADIKNSGIAPIYEDVKLVFSVYDTEGNFVTKSVLQDFNVQEVLPDVTKKVKTDIDVSTLQEKKYILCMSFENDESGNACVELPLEQYKDKIYKIGEFNW